MPGAFTPLTRSAVWTVVEPAFQKMLLSDSELCYHLPDKIYSMCSNQLFFNFSILLRAGVCTLLGSKNASELSFLGETRDDITPDEILSYFGTFPMWKRALNTIHLIQDIRSVNVRISKWAKWLKTFTIAEHSHSCAAEVYDDIISHLSVMVEAVIDHLVASNVSIMWYNVLMTIVTNMKPVWKSEHYSDIALLLSKCEDVYSADVPAALQKLTKILADSSSKDTFVQLPVEEAVTWLSSDDSGTAGKAFADFLSRHGHRCVREAELRETSWQTEPAKIVRVLQAMAQTSQQKKQTTDRLSEISDIKADLNLISRLMLYWLLPKARRAVGKREFTKSQATKTIEVFRQAYRKLAALMVNDSRLPDTDLIYFLTLREIRQVLETRSARIIARAQRRRQLYPVQMEAKYPRIFRGHPKPIEEVEFDGSTVHNSSLKLTGLPVSQGEVRGKARVVTSLDKASEIQHGEILIVPYTDIGWSPYFPMISGLVTEIGGIISHGAVIAREYGVPCVVKIPRATVLFKSGDLILLNGTVGTVEKLNC
jgi:pyruvate,water dikinase